MSYHFNPLSEAELDAINLLPEGIYNFEVFKSEHKQSKSGNDMAALQLKVWSDSGKVHIVFDYLVFSNVNMNIRKIAHFCKAVGLEDAYNKGDIPEALENYSGKLELGIQDEMPNPKGGMYPKKNVVVDYIKSGEPPAKKVDLNALIDDEELPF